MSAPLIVDPFGAPVIPAEKLDLTEKGAIVLSHFHVIAQKFNWSIRCEECGQPLQGYNAGHEKYMAVRCGCREFVAEVTPSARGRIVL